MYCDSGEIILNIWRQTQVYAILPPLDQLHFGDILQFVFILGLCARFSVMSLYRFSLFISYEGLLWVCISYERNQPTLTLQYLPNQITTFHLPLCLTPTLTYRLNFLLLGLTQNYGASLNYCFVYASSGHWLSNGVKSKINWRKVLPTKWHYSGKTSGWVCLSFWYRSWHD